MVCSVQSRSQEPDLLCPVFFHKSGPDALSKNFLKIVFQNSPADSYWCRASTDSLQNLFENFMRQPSRILLMPNVHSAHRASEYAGENRAGTGWDSMDSSLEQDSPRATQNSLLRF